MLNIPTVKLNIVLGILRQQKRVELNIVRTLKFLKNRHRYLLKQIRIVCSRKLNLYFFDLVPLIHDQQLNVAEANFEEFSCFKPLDVRQLGVVVQLT